ncbi:MAG: carboxypeptidase-like regulatory domain-containing protein [Janthinobacterium lividum]
MRKLLFLGLLLGLSRLTWAQQHLTGRLVDAVTGRPVPYASIGVLGTPLGTTSNAEGEFELRGVPLPGQLVCSELSHRRDTLVVTQISKPLLVRLVPASVQLPEVAVGSYAAELLAQAYRELQRTARHSTYGHAFYRQITRLDKQPTEVQEMVWATQTSNAGVEGTTLTQARFAKKKALLAFNNFSRYTKTVTFFDAHADSSTSQGVISLHAAHHYRLRVLGVTENGAQQLVEIGFTNQDSTARTKAGSVVIDANSHQILRLRLLTTGLHTKSNNPTFTFKNERTCLEWVFQSRPGESAQLEYLKVDYQAAVGRLLKRDVLLNVSSFTYFYDGQPTPAVGVTYLPAQDGQVDLAAIEQLPYDAAFWQQNTIVKRTPLEEEVMRSFEQQGAFGTLLAP